MYQYRNNIPAILLILFCLPVICLAQENGGKQEVIGIQTKTGVKVVYHIKVSETEKDVVSDGVAELRHLVNIYEMQGVTKDNREIHGVFDDDGAICVFNDDAYANFAKGKTNPNASIIRDLINKGVQIEVCGQRLSRDSLSANDVLPGVQVVLSGQVRVIDLQHQGCSYFRF